MSSPFRALKREDPHKWPQRPSNRTTSGENDDVLPFRALKREDPHKWPPRPCNRTTSGENDDVLPLQSPGEGGPAQVAPASLQPDNFR